jgi:hypothetical protein
MRFMQGLSRIADDYERWHHERSSAQSYLPSWQTAAVASTQARIHWSFRRANSRQNNWICNKHHDNTRLFVRCSPFCGL